jgi:hypothetical protein
VSYRPQPKYASSDAKRGAWTTCDVCGFIWNQSDMAFQFDFLGGSVPQSTGYLKCPKCMDALNYQRQLIIIPPDPPPLFNLRPENYTVDETNWLTTQDGDIIQTVDSSEPYITSIPNPAEEANTCYLTASVSYPSGSITTLYLDLFLGNPASGGMSVLSLITGSSTRTNIGSSLTLNGQNVGVNASPITVAAASSDGTNVNFIGLYSAATGGTLLASGRVAASGPLVQAGTAVVIPALGIEVDIN